MPWEKLTSAYHHELLLGAGLLAGVVLLSAIILVFLVRPLKRRQESDLDRMRTSTQPELGRSGLAGNRRGARAFPHRSAGGLEKPAASGDTTRLTPEGQSLSSHRRGESEGPRGLHGRELMIVLAAWSCLIAGLGTMTRDAENYAVSIPLLMIAFLLAVMAMAQRLVLHGSLLLASLYLAAPAIWVVHRMNNDAAQENAMVRSPAKLQKQSRQDGPVPSADTSPPATVADATSPEAKPQEAPRLLIPEDDALPAPIAATASAKPPKAPAPLPALPPIPTKAADSLFAYRAKLSRADHMNQDGVDLRTLARTKFNDVLLQERLHVHQNAKRDPEDTVDEAFGAHPLEEYRSLLEGKPIRMPSSVSLIQLLKDDVIVDVQVFEKFVQVDPVTPLAQR
ncbi:hypothetical protein DES53_102581 [Roseimicrobium gellanilyticum]|uniref:Uncharacterized protein n=2 Tax=Roseimicrobium gellanilyticum TaxID=748857 RepID=A0A366HRA0_9BACT|nr:hypothetical protein DES53_102581 [Roseimicrobium gellanilyticum]